MVKAGINSEDPLILLGLTKENIERLQKGEPISVNIKSTGVDLPGNIVIMYGETPEDIQKELEKAELIGPGTIIRGQTKCICLGFHQPPHCPVHGENSA